MTVDDDRERLDLEDPYEVAEGWSDVEWEAWFRLHHEPVAGRPRRPIVTVDPGEYL